MKKKVCELTAKEYYCIKKNKWIKNLPMLKEVHAEMGIDFNMSHPIAPVLLRKLQIFDKDLLDEELTKGCFEDD